MHLSYFFSLEKLSIQNTGPVINLENKRASSL